MKRKKLTDLCDLRLISAGGVDLGRIREVQCEVSALKDPQLCRVAAIYYGGGGILERCGFKQRSVKKIPWTSVVSIGEETVVVDLER